jgi:hypothetical protein
MSTTLTYCGLDFARRPVAVIDVKRELVDNATCRNCQKSDDRRVVENYRRECRAAGLDPVTMEPLPQPVKARP